jgi:hypothetical protein
MLGISVQYIIEIVALITCGKFHSSKPPLRYVSGENKNRKNGPSVIDKISLVFAPPKISKSY